MERINIRKPIYISPVILTAVSRTHNISSRDARKWIRTEIVKSIENEEMLVDGVPYSNKEASHRFVHEMLYLCGVSESEAEAFFNTNFVYIPSDKTTSGEIRFVQTVEEASKEMADRILADLTKQDKVELMRLFSTFE